MEETLGWSEFNRLINTVGEDALLEGLYKQLQEKTSSQGEKPQSKIKNFFSTCWYCVLMIFLPLVLLGGLGHKVTIIAGLTWIVFGFFSLSKKDRENHIIYTILWLVIGSIIGVILGIFFPGVGGIGQGVLYGSIIGAGGPVYWRYWGIFFPS